jgi:hypothetical protein
MRKIVVLALTHAFALAAGFALGVYFLPILIAPPPPSAAEVSSASAGATFKGEFRRDLKGSDLLHWGEGTVSVGPRAISLAGRVAPGPDYKLYLTPEFVDTKEGFLRVKARSARVGDVKTFENFIVAVPESIDVSRYDTVVVWCETFSMFISAAKYR